MLIFDNIVEWNVEQSDKLVNSLFCNVIYFCLFSIVREFDSIVTSLLQQQNFTNITVNGDNIAFIGERVLCFLMLQNQQL